MTTFLVLILGYLLGSIPTAHIVARGLRGINIQHYGSGTVSGTSVYYHVGLWAAILVWTLDIAKGAIPTGLGLLLGTGPSTAGAAGLAAVVGHNWSLYLRFRGGRGISPFMGLLLAVFSLGFVWMLACLAFGRLVKLSALVAILAIAATPLLAWGQPPAVGGIGVAMLLITVAKRLEANRLPLPKEHAERRRAILLRLCMDRDTKEQELWVNRHPLKDR